MRSEAALWIGGVAKVLFVLLMVPTGCSDDSGGGGVMDAGMDVAIPDASGQSDAAVGHDSSMEHDGSVEIDAASVCGNGLVEAEEECDGTDLGGKTCTDLGFDAGELRCSPECRLDESSCVVAPPGCGDGVASGGEMCDGDDMRDNTCVSLGYEDGTLGCSSLCWLDVSGCSGGDSSCDGSASSCESCQDCALAGVCREAANACQGDDDCMDFNDCIGRCDPDDSACFDACGTNHARGMTLYLAFTYCIFCNACPTQCADYASCQ